MGFGMTTVLLNLHNAGFFALGSMILAMGIFYGGLAQIIAGAMEWKKGNTFATTAFCSYGLFWMSLVALIVFPSMGIGEKTSSLAMAAYLAMWGIFTAVMFIGTLKFNRAMQFVFASLAILFFLLATGDITGIADNNADRRLGRDYLRVLGDIHRARTGCQRDLWQGNYDRAALAGE